MTTTYTSIEDGDSETAQTARPKNGAYLKAFAVLTAAGLGFAFGLTQTTLRWPQVLNLATVDWSCGGIASGYPMEKSIEEGGFKVTVSVYSTEGGFSNTDYTPDPKVTTNIEIPNNSAKIAFHVMKGDTFTGTFDGFQFSGGYPIAEQPVFGEANEEPLDIPCDGGTPIVSKPDADLTAKDAKGDVYWTCDDFAGCPHGSTAAKTVTVAATDENGVKIGMLSTYGLKISNPEVCKCDGGQEGSGGKSSTKKKKKGDGASSTSAVAGAIVGLLAAAAML